MNIYTSLQNKSQKKRGRIRIERCSNRHNKTNSKGTALKRQLIELIRETPKP